MEGQDMVVGGFAFTDKKAALKARHEAESIQYLEKQINMENPRMVLEFYKKLLAEEVFETPVGLAFLSSRMALPPSRRRRWRRLCWAGRLRVQVPRRGPRGRKASRGQKRWQPYTKISSIR